MARNAETFAANFSWEKSCFGLKAAIDGALSQPPRLFQSSIRHFLCTSGSIVFVILDMYRRYGFAKLLQQMLMYIKLRLGPILRRAPGDGSSGTYSL
jgi:hypothetical protein